MKKFFIIAALAGCMMLASCSKETPEDYAKEMVELVISKMKAQLDGKDITKYNEKIKDLEKEVNEKSKDDTKFRREYEEKYMELILNDPQASELMEKLYN